MSDQDIADAVAARLRGHDPNEWYEPDRAAIRMGGRNWVVIKKDSTLLYFSTEEDAQHFWRTGDRSKVKHDT